MPEIHEKLERRADNEDSPETVTRSTGIVRVAVVLAAFVLGAGGTAGTPRNAGRGVRTPPPVELVGANGQIPDEVLEAFLSPAEFPDRAIEHRISGDEAAFCLDSSLTASDPSVALHPPRVRWPDVAGLGLRVLPETITLRPAAGRVTDADLEAGFDIRWILVPLGERFESPPVFEARVVAAEVIAAASGRLLLSWREAPRRPACLDTPGPGRPVCDVPTVSPETAAIAFSPDGRLLSLAVGGMRPALEVHDVSAEPRLVWRAVFSPSRGGIVETAFSSDGEWVVALDGTGAMHRFDAATGGRHLLVPSSGRTARALPPGRVMAVAGSQGEVVLWYLADGTVAWRLPARKLRGPVDRMAASGDGTRFATLEYDETRTAVRVWDVGGRSLVAQVDLGAYAVGDVALDRTGERIFVSHAEQGLLAAAVDRNAEPSRFGGESGGECRSRLQWIDGKSLLACSVEGGVVLLDARGRLVSRLETGLRGSHWIVTAASSTGRMAAVGGGHLLLW